MKKIQNNSWNLFFILSGLSFVFFVILLFIEYRELEKKVEFELETNLQLVANSISYKLAEQELLLSSLGRELFFGQRSEKEKQFYLDDMLKKKPILVGFGLLNKEGDFLVTSSNILVPQNRNLIKSDSVAYYFNKTLQSDAMVLGKTHFSPVIDKWIIPTRLAIKDENENILGVMAAGFLNEKGNSFIDKLQLLDKYDLVIIKEKDQSGKFYRQYVSGFEELSEEFLYMHPLEKNFIQEVKEKLNEKYNTTIEEIRQSEELVSLITKDIVGDNQYIAMRYDKKYKIWIVLKQEREVLLHQLLRSSFFYLFIFSILFLLQFLLFKRLANTELKNKRELLFQAEHDELTNLPNRKYMYKHIGLWRRENSEGFYVLYLDLDNFKNINDKFGHTVGDKILIEVANRLKSSLTQKDMLIRQGGDEFILFLTNEYKERVDELCRSLISKLSELYIIDANEFRIGVSIGIATYPDDSRSINELLSFADTAMYKAKIHRNYYSYFTEEMRHRDALKTDIEHELRGALEKGEFYLVYQPQKNQNAQLCGVEALLRWENEKLGFISPDIFIEVAEQTGMIDEIGHFVIEKSFQEIGALQKELGCSFTLSINISVVQLMEENFLQEMMELIQKENFETSLLILEVTESLSISDLDTIVPLLESIKNEKIGISLDDFGTGYSSLGILRKLPISELKIDKSFIDNIEYNQSERELVQSIIEIGRNFQMNTVAEGVENEEQLEILKSLGCDIIQGYYYSKPLKIEQLKQYIQKETLC